MLNAFIFFCFEHFMSLIAILFPEESRTSRSPIKKQKVAYILEISKSKLISRQNYEIL